MPSLDEMNLILQTPDIDVLCLSEARLTPAVDETGILPSRCTVLSDVTVERAAGACVSCSETHSRQ